jgi:hypothetical protein
MTLVVARKTNDIAWIVSDTLVYDPKPDQPREHALKTFVIDENTVAAYTGSPNHAHGILKSLAENALAEKPRDPTSALISEHKRFTDLHGPTDIDFIVVHKGNISKISNGKSKTVNVAWIGDHRAFESFQRYHDKFQKGLATPFSDLIDPNGRAQARADLRIVNVDSVPGATRDSIAAGMTFHDTMQLVVGALSHPSVGGLVTVATSSPRGSRYLSFSGASSPIFKPVGNGWNTVDFGDAVRGGYCFTSIVPEIETARGWGIFFHQEQNGRYFSFDLKKQSFKRIEANAKNAQAFCEILQKEVGYNLRHCGSFN